MGLALFIPLTNNNNNNNKNRTRTQPLSVWNDNARAIERGEIAT